MKKNSEETETREGTEDKNFFKCNVFRRTSGIFVSVVPDVIKNKIQS